jgi:hypothetical protein
MSSSLVRPPGARGNLGEARNDAAMRIEATVVRHHTAEVVDVVVNAANNSLLGGGGGDGRVRLPADAARLSTVLCPVSATCGAHGTKNRGYPARRDWARFCSMKSTST